jgi:hypothetical protein
MTEAEWMAFTDPWDMLKTVKIERPDDTNFILGQKFGPSQAAQTS